jgi:hypothetical protein
MYVTADELAVMNVRVLCSAEAAEHRSVFPGATCLFEDLDSGQVLGLVPDRDAAGVFAAVTRGVDAGRADGPADRELLYPTLLPGLHAALAEASAELHQAVTMTQYLTAADDSDRTAAQFLRSDIARSHYPIRAGLEEALSYLARVLTRLPNH